MLLVLALLVFVSFYHPVYPFLKPVTEVVDLLPVLGGPELVDGCAVSSPEILCLLLLEPFLAIAPLLLAAPLLEVPLALAVALQEHLLGVLPVVFPERGIIAQGLQHLEDRVLWGSVPSWEDEALLAFFGFLGWGLI